MNDINNYNQDVKKRMDKVSKGSKSQFSGMSEEGME
jgi:hypothetical protein